MPGSQPDESHFYRMKLQNCGNLQECENMLDRSIPEVDFLGQFDTTTQDFNRLEELVKTIAKGSRHSLDKVFKSYPSSISLYLVLKGIYEYDGKYWPKVRKELNVDTNAQNDLGAQFLEYLEANNLVLVKEPEGFKYRSNILLQGFLPLSLLEDFMGESTLSKIVSSGGDGESPTKKASDLAEVRNKLDNVKLEILSLREEVGANSQDLLKHWEELENLTDLENEIKPAQEILPSLEKDPEELRKRLKLKLFARQRHSTIIKSYLSRASNNKKEGSLAYTKRAKVSSRLNEIEEEKINTRDKLKRIDEFVESYSNGDFKEGLGQLRKLKRKSKKLKERKRKLKEDIEHQRELTDLKEQQLEIEEKAEELDKSGREYLNKKVSRKEQLLQKKENLDKNGKRLKGDLRDYESPIRIFLIYGNNFPELIESEIKRLRKNKTNRRQEVDKEDYELPIRYVEAVLVNDNQKTDEDVKIEEGESEKEEEGSKGLRQRLRRPRVNFDTSEEKVTVKLPPQIIKGLEKARETKFCYSDNCYKLKPFRKGEKYYSTKEEEIELEPSSEYSFKMNKGKELLNKWQVETRTEEFPVWVFESDGEFIKDEKLPKAQVWFVLPENLSPEGEVLISGSMGSKWVGYNYYKVNLSDLTTMKISAETGQQVSLSVERGSLPDLKLLKNKLVSGVTLEDSPIYCSPPTIRLPLQEHDDVEEWEAKLHRYPTRPEENKKIEIELDGSSLILQKRGKYYLLDLTNMDEFEGYFRLCRLSIENQDLNYTDETVFCLIPDFDYDFDKSVYLPEKGGLNEGEVEIQLPSQLKTEPEFENTFSRYEEGITSSFSLKNKDWLNFELKCSESELEGAYNLKLEVPKLTWSVPQLEGKVLDTEEKSKRLYFLKDLEGQEGLDLYLTLPNYYTGKAVLSLTGSRKKTVSWIRDGRVKIDLQGFLEALRHGRERDKTKQTFRVSFPDQDKVTHKVDLFTIQNHWKIEDLKAETKEEKSKVRIKAKWNLKGKADNQVLLIWRRADKEKVLKEKIDSTSENFEITFSKEDLESGEYILHVTNQPPYSETEIEYPVDSVRELYGSRVDFQPSTIIGESKRIEHKSYVDNFNI